MISNGNSKVDDSPNVPMTLKARLNEVSMQCMIRMQKQEHAEENESFLDIAFGNFSTKIVSVDT